MDMRRHGVTLIETVLCISVTLALIIGGVVVFQQAASAQKTGAAIRQSSAVVAEARALNLNNSFEFILTGTVPSVGLTHVAADAVPLEYVKVGTLDESPTTLINPQGGATKVCGFLVKDFGAFIAGLTGNVPVSACTCLIASNVDPADPMFAFAATAVADGSDEIGVRDTGTGSRKMLPRSFSVSQAGAACGIDTQASCANNDSARNYTSAGNYTGFSAVRPQSVGLWTSFRLY